MANIFLFHFAIIPYTSTTKAGLKSGLKSIT
jgi:hypothetical protein